MMSRTLASRHGGSCTMRKRGQVSLLAILTVLVSTLHGWSQEEGGQNSSQSETPASQESESAEVQPPSDPGNKTPFEYQVADDEAGLRRLMPDHEVWFDVKQKIVVANSEVVLTRGPLEMFACPPMTKEHESVLRVKSAAFVIHAGLLAVGAKSGHPVKFDPEYEAAKGQEIDIFLVWKHDGKQRWAKAQDWVLNSRTRKPMKTHWVFAGSGYWVNPDNGTRHYLAESGELICVSNFSTATLDLPVESSQANGGLLFEANTENIPPRGTAVKMVLVPKVEKKKNQDEKEKSSDADAKVEDKKSTADQDRDDSDQG